MDASLTDIFCYLLSGRVGDFCGRILASLEQQATNAVDMMAVGVRDRHFVLLYNPNWLTKAHYDDVVTTIHHETYHLLFEHIPRHLEFEATLQHDAAQFARFQRAAPYAADLAVNSLLIEEPSSTFMRAHKQEWVLPQQQPFVLYPRKKRFEWYAQKIMDDSEKDENLAEQLTQLLLQLGFGSGKQAAKIFQTAGKQQHAQQGDRAANESDGARTNEEGSGGSTGTQTDEEEKARGLGWQLLKNHRDWSDYELGSSSEDKVNLADELRYQTKTIVKKAVEDQMKAAGSIPGNFKEIIEKLLKEPQVPWTRIFRNLVASAKRTRRHRSLARPRRRYIATPAFIPFPGKKKDYAFHIAFIIDTSGSMHTRELEMALNELAGMRRVDKNMLITVIEADAVVRHEYQLDSKFTKIKYSVTGRGGTSFDPALRRARELRPRCDAVFYFTDGYADPPRKENRVPCPFAWIITPKGRVPDQWGRCIFTRPYV